MIVRINAFITSIVIAIPYVLIQLWYLSDIHKWNVALGYGAIFLYGPLVLVVWGIGVWIEKRWRKKHGPSLSLKTWPWFSICGLAALILFFEVGDWVRPVVMDKPEWCRVSQVAKWETSKLNKKYNNHETFILVYGGKGNIKTHQFKWAYLNWTGDEPAGFSDITIEPLLYSFSSSCGATEEPLDYDIFRNRISNSGLHGKELDVISGSIWQSLIGVRRDSVVIAPGGETEKLWSTPSNFMDIKLGGVVWCISVVFTFIIINQLFNPINCKKKDCRTSVSSGTAGDRGP